MKKIILLATLLSLASCASAPDLEKLQMQQALGKYENAAKASTEVHFLDASKIKNLEDVAAIFDTLNYRFTENAFTTKEEKAQLAKIRHLFKVEAPAKDLKPKEVKK